MAIRKGYFRIGVDVPIKMKEQLDALALQEQENRSYIIRNIIREYVKKSDATK